MTYRRHLHSRPGSFLPKLFLAIVLAEVGARWIPLRDLAFRPYEKLLVYSGDAAPFIASRRVEMATVGDLANLGGVWFPVDRRREAFSTDAAGFRNSGNVAGPGPVGAALFGDSFVVGVGLSDAETLAARLREAAGYRVFNAGGAGGRNPVGMARILDLAGLAPGGTVVAGFSVLEEFPAAPTLAGGLPRPVPFPPTWEERNLHVSRLGILSRRTGAWLAGLARIEPGNGAVRRPLANGDWMLFLSRDSREVRELSPAAVGSWARLHRDLGERGFGLLVLLIPAKGDVYSDSLAESRPDRPSRAAPLIAEALSARDVPVLDLEPILRAAAREGLPQRRYVYWRDDTHWNPRGVKIAAAALARALADARTVAAGTGRERGSGASASSPRRP